MTPYVDNLEHLLDELSRINRLIHIYLEKVRADLPEYMDEFMGLYASEDEIQKLPKSSGFGKEQKVLPSTGLEEIKVIRRQINNKKLESLKNCRELRLHILSELFSLDEFEIDVLLIGAPEIGLKSVVPNPLSSEIIFTNEDIIKKSIGIIESFVMTAKNDSISGVDKASLLALFSEFLSIITLPDETNYSYQKFLNVLLHAATSSTDSLESANNDLRSKTLDVIDINGLSKNYSILMESLFERIKKMGMKVGTVYMDREFFNREVISKMDEHKLDFVIAAKSNKKIKEIPENHRKEFGDTSTVFKFLTLL